MADIDPQEFGRLQADVQGLRRDNDEQMKMLQTLTSDMTAIRLQLAEAKGGWKLLVMLGGASSVMGGFVTWAATHFSRGSP